MLNIKEEWASGIFDCMDNPYDCLWIWCCTSCSICCEHGLGSSLDLHDTHVGTFNCLKWWCSNLDNVFCNVLCDCPCGRKWVTPCYYSLILDAMVSKYNLPYPEPCGDSLCCDCRLQMCFCGTCTLCLIQRELKARNTTNVHYIITNEPY